MSISGRKQADSAAPRGQLERDQRAAPGPSDRKPGLSSFSYGGNELEAMAEARNYYRWILSIVGPYVGKRVVEIGAGVGNFAAALLQATPVSELTLVEPAENLFPELARRFSADPRVRVVQGFMQEDAAFEGLSALISVNVIEHIDDDREFLRAGFTKLAPGGRIIIFAPALAFLYGSLDRNFGHCRRYSKTDLAGKLVTAGFRLEVLRYFNFPGVLAWFLTGRVLRRQTLRASSVRAYDRWVVPWLAKLELRWTPPLGQSLLAIARKPLAGE
jgi:SAM-dependent methyltransferase